MLSFYICSLVGKHVASLSDDNLKISLATLLLDLFPQLMLVLLLALGKPLLLE